ncbi:MAG TPA: hypothetical protein VI756_07830 [Blastocatellia bacterium]
MKLFSLPALAALTTVLVLGAFAQTQKPGDHKTELTDVKATGCTYRSGPAGCLLMKTLDGKTIYNIVTVDPVPQNGIVVIIEAKPHHGRVTCKEGISVDVTRWESTGETCAR